MDALRFYGIHDVRFETIEKPRAVDGEVLIKIAYAGICGSDLHIYNKAMFVVNIPETMGHEFVGTVAEIGAHVSGFIPGDIVVANPMVPCMECERCRQGKFNTCRKLGFIGEVSQGCFAEYIAVRQEKLIKAGPGADMRGLVLSEPLAVAVHICKRARFSPQDKIAVFGAGPIGLLTVAAARQLFGVRNITVVDIAEARLSYAGRAGASATCGDVSKLEGEFDKIVESAGAPITFRQALRHLKPQGALFVVSIYENELTLDINEAVSGEESIVGCNVYTHEDLKDAVSAIEHKKLDVGFLISHEFSLKDGKKAFETLTAGSKAAEKVIFNIAGFVGANYVRPI